MGLDISHDGWHGAYSAWNRIRTAVCQCHGLEFSYPYHYLRDENNREIFDEHGYHIINKELDPKMWYASDEGVSDGVRLFLSHSDCEGSLSPKESRMVADALEEILPMYEEYTSHIKEWGHIERNGGYVACLKAYINACRTAAKKRQRLRYG